MCVISECVACVVVAITVSAFLTTLSVLFLTIKDKIENRTGTSRAFQEAGTLLRPRLATVTVRAHAIKPLRESPYVGADNRSGELS
jgi:hypothetical protein